MNRGRINSRNVRPPQGQDGNGPGRGRQRGRAGAVAEPNQGWFARHKVLSVVLGVLVAGMAFFGYEVWHATHDPLAVLQNHSARNTQDPAESQGGAQTNAATDATATGASQSAEPTASGELPPNYNFTNDCVNFLILGADGGDGRGSVMGGTDCVILMSVNVKTKSATLVSIPRDTYVKIYNANNKSVARNRINSAFNFGGGLKKNGVAYAENTVNQFMAKGQIPIDHYVFFNMDLVTRLIDAVGGVDVNVSGLDHDTITTETGFTFNNNTTMHMGGYMALAYARDRHHTVKGDQGRVAHQRDVIIALLKKLQDGGNIVKAIPQLYSTFQKYITTDLSDLNQLIALAWIAKDISIGGIKQYTVTGTPFDLGGASYLVADQENKAQIVMEVFGIANTADDTWTATTLKAEIMALLNKTKQAVTDAESYLSSSAGYYTDDEAAPLKAAIAQWHSDYNGGDTDACDDDAQVVAAQLDVLKGIVDPRKQAISDARDKISWAQGKLSSLGDYISSSDKSTINSLISSLQAYVDSKDYNDAPAATAALVNTATPIFSAAQAAKDSSTPAPTATTTAA